MPAFYLQGLPVRSHCVRVAQLQSHVNIREDVIAEGAYAFFMQRRDREVEERRLANTALPGLRLETLLLQGDCLRVIGHPVRMWLKLPKADLSAKFTG